MGFGDWTQVPMLLYSKDWNLRESFPFSLKFQTLRTVFRRLFLVFWLFRFCVSVHFCCCNKTPLVIWLKVYRNFWCISGGWKAKIRMLVTVWSGLPWPLLGPTLLLAFVLAPGVPPYWRALNTLWVLSSHFISSLWPYFLMLLHWVGKPTFRPSQKVLKLPLEELQAPLGLVFTHSWCALLPYFKEISRRKWT